MTPQEKAEKLFNQMLGCNPNRQDGISAVDTIQAKLCAKIAVDELIKELTEEISPSVHGFRHQYWQQVKKHIQEL